MLPPSPITRHLREATAESPAVRQRLGRDAAAPPPTLRDMQYRLWKVMPPWSRRLAVRLFVPRVSLGVCAVIRDGYGRVLLAHHPYRNAWGLPGGFVKSDEQPAAALMREIREELGAEASVGPLLAAHAAPGDGHLTLYYATNIVDKPHPNGVEIDVLRHVPEETLHTLLDPTALVWLPTLHHADAA